ncbi:putative nicotinamide N-methyase [Dongia mobilis]|uniref:Putative nicotinamide N-methyase n=1 Tax=Dongia mobilis TaxID=578943 RepID=A0A4R6WRG4_9PROT|nr:50S ribosomal protein L11 methyltransferase [Dongia mobilis]TDQ84185.1 putative nicotinamide N-methyase [Dongia mobilis]
MTDPVAFVRRQTRISRPALVPEIRLYLADEMTPIWLATQGELDDLGVPPPFWAFCWPGGQALTRFILDHPEWVRGKRVLDFAAGSGITAIAAARAGAATVTAAEIDAHAIAAIALNAELNGATVQIEPGNIVGSHQLAVDVVLAGDICYEQPMANRVTAWLAGLARDGVTVLMGDPGRSYLPQSGLKELARYVVPTSTDLEDSDRRETTIWQLGVRQ